MTSKLKTSSPSKLAKELGIHRWDYMIIGDGSGTVWDQTGGWASVLFQREAKTKRWFSGDMSHATNILMEMMAVVHPLLWLSQQDTGSKRVQVHVLTDCEYVMKAGNKMVRRKKNLPLWTLLDSMILNKLVVTYHWVPRDTIPPQNDAHDLANVRRKKRKEELAK